MVDKQNKVEWENPTARWQMEGARTKHPTERAVGNPARLASLRRNSVSSALPERVDIAEGSRDEDGSQQCPGLDPKKNAYVLL